MTDVARLDSRIDDMPMIAEATDEEQADQPRLIAAADDDPFPIPEIAEPYQRAPELEALVEDLLKRDAPEIDDLQYSLRSARVRYLWRQKGGSSQGKNVLARCVKVGGLAAHYSRGDFVVWCACDHLTETAPTYEQMRAILFHELSHIQKDMTDDGEVRWSVRGHDFELFEGELSLFGPWREDLQRASRAFGQLGLGV